MVGEFNTLVIGDGEKKTSSSRAFRLHVTHWVQRLTCDLEIGQCNCNFWWQLCGRRVEPETMTNCSNPRCCRCRYVDSSSQGTFYWRGSIYCIRTEFKRTWCNDRLLAPGNWCTFLPPPGASRQCHNPRLLDPIPVAPSHTQNRSRIANKTTEGNCLL